KIGDRKASSAIVARVFPHAGKTVPQRLHEATYDGFASPHWYASESPLQPVTAPAHSATWILGEVAGIEDRFTVAVTTDRRRTVLALPWGALRLKDLRVDGLLRNDLGVVEIRQNPGPLRFTVAFDPRVSRQTTPTERDLVVPVSEREHVTAVAADLNLVAASPAQALQALERWFRSEFDYALFQPERLPSRSPLADFLTTTRAGHCEYFATATVLLLRAAGIPARYATGFAVQEFSERERAYLVRERHAHAWARAYVDGRWRDVDTTPATWHTIESEQDAFFQPLSDYLSWLLFAHRQWQAEAAPRRLTWLWLALLPVLGYAAWRLWKRRAPRTGSKVEPAQRTIVATGLDSAFYRLDLTLRDTPLARAPDELVSTWIERLSQRLPGVPDIADLRQIIALHYRYRFDPVGLEHDERQRLAELVDAWLVRFREANGA
ncbi:MAG: transglutaminase domain-containing protein, partial [Gammaproteobacteria bacterium]|nr:transglutaminase domain-containing protein [Gammaproteobacteria bacterium]